MFPIEKMRAHSTGQLHLAVSVFLFSGDEMLIQQRAAGKYHCGRLWANSCCTHPHWNERPEIAAQRRTREELGASVTLTPAGRLTYRASVGQGLIEHERVQLFQARVDKAELCLDPDPQEIMGTRWVSRAAIGAAIRNRPQDFAPWFRIYMARWQELGFGETPMCSKKSRAPLVDGIATNPG